MLSDLWDFLWDPTNQKVAGRREARTRKNAPVAYRVLTDV